MGITRNIFKWLFENIAPGEVNPEKRVDADRIMDNYNTIASAVAVIEARGENAHDGNSNGVSTRTQCNLTLLTEQGIGGLIDEGDIVEISDGTNIWQKRTTDEPATYEDDEISFSDANLISGEGPSDYSDTGFISSLLFTIRKAKHPDIVRAERIQLEGSGCLTGELIRRSEADNTKIEEALSEVISGFLAQHNEDGSHKQSVLIAENLEDECFTEEGFTNLIDGTFDNDPDGDGCAYPWSAYNEPQLSLSTSPVYEGDYSQKLTATQASDGVELTLTEVKNLRGKKITISVWIYTEGPQARIEVYDGTNTHQSEPFGTEDEWERGALTCTIASDAEDIKVRINLMEAGTAYLDAAQITTGTLDIAYSHSPEIAVRRRLSDISPINLIMGFERWTGEEGATFHLPDGWMIANSQPMIVNRTNVAKAVGQYSCEIRAMNNQGIMQEIPSEFITQMRGEEINLSLYLSRLEDSGGDPVRISIVSGLEEVASCEIDTSSIPTDTFRRFSISGQVPQNASIMSVRIENMAGTQSDFHILADGIMLTPGRDPIAYFPCNIYDTLTLAFSIAGAIESGYLAGPSGIAGEGWVLPYNVRASRLSAYLGVPPQPGNQITVYLRVNGENTALSTTLSDQNQRTARFEMVHILSDEDTFGLYCIAPLENGASDLYCILEVLKPRL